MMNLVEFSGKVRLMAVCEVSSVGKVHRQDAVSRRKDGEVNSHVRLAATVRLHIDVLGGKEPLCALDGQ